MDKRYIYTKESESEHCCFTHTVIDTAGGKEDYGDYWKVTICECFDEKYAILITDTLNKMEEMSKTTL